MKKINSYFTEKQIEALRKLSADTGLTVAELLRRAIDHYLGKDSGIQKTNTRDVLPPPI